MMQPWFSEAKLGIFIHWGIHAVNGKEASWSYFNHGRPGLPADRQQSHAEYFAQLGRFAAERYDPEAWAERIARAGARYAVLTTRHHDGVALWDTAHGDLDVVRRTPARRDLVGPFCAALRRHQLRVGLYYSHSDWSHPDYASVRHAVAPPLPPTDVGYRYAYPTGPDDPARWERYLAYHRGQVQELCLRYRPDLLWFDGDWERSAEQWRFAELRERLRRWAPGAVLNSRMGDQGDYATPEQGQPMRAPAGPWEFCMTMNDQWGWAAEDLDYKPLHQLVRVFCETIAMGGNLLLNIGPLADGTIDPRQGERLDGLGAWIARHAEAIHPTTAGLPPGHLYGTSTISRDRTVVYATVFDRPWREFAVRGIRNRVVRVSLVDGGLTLPHRISGGAGWSGAPGTLWIAMPERGLDPLGTVLRIELEGPLDLYTGAGLVVTAN